MTETPETEGMTERELLVTAVRMLGHIDVMTHEVLNAVNRALPYLDRFSGGLKSALNLGGKRHAS